MSKDLAKANGGLPANISAMVSGLVAASDTVSTGGFLFMKLAKGTGEFVYGPEEIEVEDGSIWAINPMSLQYGWVAWGDKAHGTAGKNLGEHMGPASKPIYDQASLRDVEGSWSQQVGFDLACTNGEDEGTTCRYLTNSFGGKKAWKAVLDAVVKKLTDGDPEYVPLVRLSSTSYKHDEYGKIHNPEFIITGWMAMEAEAPEQEEEEQEEPPTKPKRKRKAKAKAAAPAEEEAEPEEEEEEETPKPRRRRRKAS